MDLLGPTAISANTRVWFHFLVKEGVFVQAVAPKE